MRLISQVAKEIWLCEQQNVTVYKGDIYKFKMKLRKDMNLQESLDASNYIPPALIGKVGGAGDDGGDGGDGGEAKGGDDGAGGANETNEADEAGEAGGDAGSGSALANAEWPAALQGKLDQALREFPADSGMTTKERWTAIAEFVGGGEDEEGVRGTIQRAPRRAEEAAKGRGRGGRYNGGRGGGAGSQSVIRDAHAGSRKASGEGEKEEAARNWDLGRIRSAQTR